MTPEELARRMGAGARKCCADTMAEDLLPYAEMILDMREALREYHKENRLHHDDDWRLLEMGDAALVRADALIGPSDWEAIVRRAKEGR